MLSRKTSNMIFYIVLAAILLVVVATRFILVGAMNNRIDDTISSNRSLQNKIEYYEQAVQDNKDTASDHLYELYDYVPAKYDQNQLVYYTEAQLDLIGVYNDEETQRFVNVDDEIIFQHTSVFYEIQNEFKCVQVSVYFNTQDIESIDSFVDALYSSEQMFIISKVEFHNVENIDVGVTIRFVAFYEAEETE